MASGFEVGTAVRVGKASSIPQRYQGRTAQVVGTTVNTRGTTQYLVSFGQRRATPLPLNQRQFRVI